MERVIDRSAYRRNISTVKPIKKENIKYAEKKIKKFLYQLLISASIFLFLTIAKLYKIEPIMAWVDSNVMLKIDIKEFFEYGQNAIIELNRFVQNLENYKEIPENDKIIEEQIKNENIISEGISDETKFEEAVEGVNQLVEDAEYIKENYKLKHAIIGTVTSEFGVRESENKIVTPYHSGIDVAANKGTNIYASIGGEVITATTDNAYGKYIMIQTDDVVTLYAHCSELKVKKGQKVKQGEVIGKVGSTGWATGPHLHFEIRLDGKLVNPADVLDYSQMGAK
ncbi:MAG: peptidoglycan DD-metalloendopeptidase family protein [Clostridia bacterium]|nr:peptidoglycan DD-metalloendopeptidase family protein [Clostridia bacterium]